METSVVRRRKRSASAERIKNAYNGANNVEVEVIEAVGTAKTDDTPKEMRVCAYCRVSTEEESQQSSYELQVQHYNHGHGISKRVPTVMQGSRYFFCPMSRLL